MNTSITPNTAPRDSARNAALVRVGAHRPGIEEQQFDVEHQEQDRHQVEPHVERLPRVADRVHARLVGHLLDGRLLARPDHVGQDQRGRHEAHQDQRRRPPAAGSRA